MEEGKYRERLINVLAETAHWTYHTHDLSYEHIKDFVQEASIVANADDALIRDVYNRVLELRDSKTIL